METADVDISKYFFVNLTLKDCISFSPLSSSIVFCGMSYVVMMLSAHWHLTWIKWTLCTKAPKLQRRLQNSIN